MQRYRILTLIDITRSYASRSESNKIKVGQQSNFNSFLQTIGLRSNIDWIQDPILHTGRLPEPLEGKANHWVWEFDVEREDVFLKDKDPVGHLVDDLHGVPVVIDLHNTVEISPAAIQTKGNNVNTWVQII